MTRGRFLNRSSTKDYMKKLTCIFFSFSHYLQINFISCVYWTLQSEILTVIGMQAVVGTTRDVITENRKILSLVAHCCN